MGYFCGNNPDCGRKNRWIFLFIAGDLFHKQPLKRELKEVCGLFVQIPRTKVILMAGNHDYMQMNSYYRTCEFPENVFFFSREEVTGFDFPEENVTVYGSVTGTGRLRTDFTMRCAR